MPAWRPWTEGDIGKLETVQQKFVSQVSGLCSRDYVERARECGLRTVRDSMDRGDMIALYRIVSGVDKVDPTQFFRPAVVREGATSTRSSTVVNDQGDVQLGPRALQLPPRCNTDMRRNQFSQRSVRKWSSLHPNVTSSQTVHEFKQYYDIHH